MAARIWVWNMVSDKLSQSQVQTLVSHFCGNAKKVESGELLVYDKFLSYFRERATTISTNPVTETEFYMWTHMIYCWMPTMLDTYAINIQNNLGKALNTINFALVNRSNNIYLSRDDLKCLSLFANNSLVGVSKLLHLIDPVKYVIWDTQVAKAVKEIFGQKLSTLYFNCKSESDWLKSIIAYEWFQNLCIKTSASLWYLEFHQIINRCVKHQVSSAFLGSRSINDLTPQRSLEMILYLRGQQLK